MKEGVSYENRELFCFRDIEIPFWNLDIKGKGIKKHKDSIIGIELGYDIVEIMSKNLVFVINQRIKNRVLV